MSGAPPDAATAEAAIEAELRGWVLDAGFPCVGAKSALRRGGYRVQVYGEMGSPEASERLAADLADFVREQDPSGDSFTTFVAGFTSPHVPDEAGFERLLWAQLQRLHDLDAAPWAPNVSMDPADASFAFSFARRAFFVVGLHPRSSRVARRFAWPALAFNARFQFDRLRERGAYSRMRDVIRQRDTALQGDTNPMLSDFGQRSEARQYSGRAVDDAWRCPFHPCRDSACDPVP